jgi:hypothetical protein
MKLLPKFFPRDTTAQAAKFEKDLLRMEAKIGGELFGPVAKGHKRQFFCLDRHTWVWHEEWQDSKGKLQTVTTCYNVRPDGVLKSQNSQPYQPISMMEARNLYQASELYRSRVGAEYNRMLQTA